MSNQWQKLASEAARRHLATASGDGAQDALDRMADESLEALQAALPDPAPAVEGLPCTPGRCANGCTNEPCKQLSDPAPTVEAMDDTKGPWFTAAYSGSCSACFNRTEVGDEIRADGEGGYECSECYPYGDREPVARPTVPTADEFMDPGPVTAALPTADEFMDPAVPDVKVNVSGQPEARRDWLGRYIVVDPGPGDFRRTKTGKPIGITRVTTFVKAAANNKAINDWQKRNVVMGASLRPDVLRRAHGLNHDNGKDELDRIVGELDTAAGGKVSADEGTYLHEESEFIDAGLKQPEDCPAAYQDDLRRYVAALAEHGLEPVPGLIERTVMIQGYGGVVGTFDRVFFHRPSGTYLIGDLKTGKTLKYGIDEIQAQLWCYAHGLNQNGVYDWNTDTWGRAWPDMSDQDPDEYEPIQVREDLGVIIHMPVQGPEAGQVYVRRADLARGAEYAALCASVRDWKKSPVEDWTGVPDAPLEAPAVPDAELTYGDWTVMFAGVATSEEATALWRRVKAVGVTGIKLNALIAVAQESLRVKG